MHGFKLLRPKSDIHEVKGLEKLTTIRLAEVLTQKGTVTTEKITDALYTHDKTGEPFVDLLISGGHITEWDLAKLVVEHFQLPFVMASSYDVGTEARTKLPEDVLFKNMIVPLDMFGDLMIVAMPIMTPFERLDKIEKKFNVDVFPYVGLTSENKKVLGELYKSFNDWKKSEDSAREKRAAVAKSARPEDAPLGDAWQNIFDSADARVRESSKPNPKR